MQVGADDNCGKNVRTYCIRSAGKVIDTDIAEAKEGQLRMTGLESFLTEIKKYRYGSAIVFCIKVSVFVKNFRMGKLNTVACVGV